MDYAALVASVVALLIAVFGSEISYKRSNLIAEKVLVKTWHNNVLYIRLAVKNEPKVINRVEAKQVEVNVVEKTNKKAITNNFVPAPLEWTHPTSNDNLTQRSIRPNQTALLDICRWYKPPNNNRHLLMIRAPHVDNTDITNVDVGDTKLKLSVYQASGQKLDWTIKINWPDTESEPKVKFLS